MADYNINYEDERLTQLGNQKENAINEMNSTYSGMISEADKYYQAQIDASKEWAQTQQNLQNQQTEFAIQEINQNKEQARKDYLKEQSGSYVDWQKQANKYGAEAERMAASGLTGTGYSESSQVAMYNQYQSRVAVARESYNLAVQNYNNAITEARLQNNSALAQIAYQALQTQLELSLQGFQYKNTLLLDQMDKKTALEDTYWQREQDVLTQLNNERDFAYRQEQDAIANNQWQAEFDETVKQNEIKNNQWQQSFEEEQRQHDETLAFNKEQAEIKNSQWAQEFEESIRQWNESFEEDKRQYNQSYQLEVEKFNESVNQWQQEYQLGVDKYNSSLEQFEREMARLEASDAADKEYRKQQLELQKQELEEEKRQFDAEMKLKADELDLQRQELDILKNGDETGDTTYSSDIVEKLGIADKTPEQQAALIENWVASGYLTEVKHADGTISFEISDKYTKPQDRPDYDRENDDLDSNTAAKNFASGKYSVAELRDMAAYGDVSKTVKDGKVVYEWTEKGKRIVGDLGGYYTSPELYKMIESGTIVTYRGEDGTYHYKFTKKANPSGGGGSSPTTITLK